MEAWKIDRRKRGCSTCQREFKSEEKHVSAIRSVENRFERFDACLACWEKQFPAGTETPFSFWRTVAPKREKKRLEDIVAMTEFFKRLLERKSADPVHEKVAYITALLLMRKRKVKNGGSKVIDGRAHIVLEKSWDGETVAIPDPVISDPELESLRMELERLFDIEQAAPEAAQPAATV